jgi:hypothetical protein
MWRRIQRTSLARVANLSVLLVSSIWAAAGVMLQRMEMRAPLPVMEFCAKKEDSRKQLSQML